MCVCVCVCVCVARARVCECVYEREGEGKGEDRARASQRVKQKDNTNIVKLTVYKKKCLQNHRVSAPFHTHTHTHTHTAKVATTHWEGLSIVCSGRYPVRTGSLFLQVLPVVCLQAYLETPY